MRQFDDRPRSERYNIVYGERTEIWENPPCDPVPIRHFLYARLFTARGPQIVQYRLCNSQWRVIDRELEKTARVERRIDREGDFLPGTSQFKDTSRGASLPRQTIPHVSLSPSLYFYFSLQRWVLCYCERKPSIWIPFAKRLTLAYRYRL